MLQGSFDGRHHLRPEVSQPCSRMDRVSALHIAILELLEEKAFLRQGWIGTSSRGGGGEWDWRAVFEVIQCKLHKSS